MISTKPEELLNIVLRIMLEFRKKAQGFRIRPGSTSRGGMYRSLR